MLTTCLMSEIPGQLGWGNLPASPTHHFSYAARVATCPSLPFWCPVGAHICAIPAKEISPRCTNLVEVGGNSHPQAQPCLITSPCEEAQACKAAEETTLHPPPQSPAEAALSILSSRASRGHTCLCSCMENHTMTLN